ncbi:MAG: hypothetical protein WC055_00225 [Melioribacteraceae bacterium]
MLIRDTKEVYRFKVENAVGKNATAKNVLDYLFGEYLDERGKANFVLREWSTDHKTALNRINMFWAIPFTLICSPYRYITKGFIGWDTKTVLGRFILRVTGHLRET